MKRGEDYELFEPTAGPANGWVEWDGRGEPTLCTFVWNDEGYSVDLTVLRFPIVITRRGELREATQRDHWRRVWLTLRGEWKPEYEIGDRSPNKGFWEITHALKNVAVEGLRAAGVWNRGGKPWYEPSGYDWSEWKPLKGTR